MCYRPFEHVVEERVLRLKLRIGDVPVLQDREDMVADTVYRVEFHPRVVEHYLVQRPALFDEHEHHSC